MESIYGLIIFGRIADIRGGYVHKACQNIDCSLATVEEPWMYSFKLATIRHHPTTELTSSLVSPPKHAKIGETKIYLSSVDEWQLTRRDTPFQNRGVNMYQV